MNLRYYNPEWGRFINADGQLNDTILGKNLYAYCENNPINCIDSNGTSLTLVGVITLGLIVVMVCYALPPIIDSITNVDRASLSFGSSSSTSSTSNKKAQTDKIVSATVAVSSPNNSRNNNDNDFDKKLNKKVNNSKKNANVENDIINKKRVNSALKREPYHVFPDIIDNYVEFAEKIKINNGTLYQLRGAYNGIDGRFEWITQGEKVTHRMFILGGGINGIPIIP